MGDNGNNGVTEAPPTAPSKPLKHPALSMSNIKSIVTEVLDYSNYLLWRELFVPVLHGYQVYDHIDGTAAPSPESSEYIKWNQVDNLVLSWIQSTLSRDILQSIITPGQRMTAHMAWTKIERMFHDHVESRIVQLRQEFYGLTKQESSMKDFLSKLKDIYDCRVSVGDTVTSRDLLLQIVMGLGRDYNAITSIFLSQQPPPTFEQMKSILFIEESKLKNQQPQVSVPTDQVLIAHRQEPTSEFVNSKGRGNQQQHRGGGRTHRGGRGGRTGGRGTRSFFQPFRPHQSSSPGLLGPSPISTPSNQPNRPVGLQNYQNPIQCYTCGGFGHGDRFCPSQPKATNGTPHAISVYPASDSGNDPWILDSGATSHMTNHAGSSYEDTTSQLH